MKSETESKLKSAFDKKKNPIASEAKEVYFRKTQYEYENHRLKKMINPLNQETSYEYDKAGNLTSILKPGKKGKKIEHKYKYDDLDRVEKEIDPIGIVTDKVYDAMGNIENVTQTSKGGKKRITQYGHDNEGNVTCIKQVTPEDTAGHEIRKTYNALNLVETESYVKNATEIEKSTHYNYDLNGRFISSMEPNEKSIKQNQYDEMGNVIRTLDGENGSATVKYDKSNRPEKVTQEYNKAETSYEYDQVGNVKKRKDGNGQITEYTYDSLNKIKTSKNALGEIEKLERDSAGRLLRKTSPSGKIINYDYDELDRLISKSYGNHKEPAGSPDVKIKYDDENKTRTMTDLTGTGGTWTSEYEYDEFGRIQFVTNSNNQRIEYQYDDFGNLEKLIYPDGKFVSYEYDAMDQLKSVTDQSGTDQSGEITLYTRDHKGQVTLIERKHSQTEKPFSVTNITYTSTGQVKILENLDGSDKLGANKLVSKYEYEYIYSGNIRREVITQQVAFDKLQITENLYEYYTDGQIKKVTSIVDGKATVTSYKYDKNGNRAELVRTGTDEKTVIYNYMEKDEKTTVNRLNSRVETKKDGQKITTEYEYDKDGNLKLEKPQGQENQIYEYDYEGHLKSVKEGGTLLMAALYNGDGDRVFSAQRVAADISRPEISNENKNSARNEVYDAFMKSCELKDEDLQNYDQRSYVNDINREHTQVLMEYNQNGNVMNSYTYGEQRESITSNGLQCNEKKNYYIYDGRGSVANLLDTNGANALSYNYDEFGQQTSNPDLNAAGGNNNPYGYNAESTDSNTGLQYLRARYYNPTNGNFITQDTYMGELTDPISQNRYAYAGNNPVNRIDPSGESWNDIWNGAKKIYHKVVDTGKHIYNNYVKPYIPPEWDRAIHKMIQPLKDLKNCVRNLIAPSQQNAVNNGNNSFLNNLVDGGKKIFGLAAEGGAFGTIAQKISYAKRIVEERKAEAYKFYCGFAPKMQKGFDIVREFGKRGSKTAASFARDYMGERWTRVKKTSLEDMAREHPFNGPSLDEAAVIAHHVYKGEIELKGGWKMIDKHADGSLKMGFYERENPNNGKMEYVVANRGSIIEWNLETIQCWKNNLQQPSGDSDDMSASIDKAKDFVGRYPGSNITFVGHSKGGGEAVANAVETNKNVITFNAAIPNLDAYGLNIGKYHGSMTKYIVEGEILNSLEEKAVGHTPKEKVIYLPSSHKARVPGFVPAPVVKDAFNLWKGYKNHGMDAVFTSIKKWKELK